MTTSRFRRPLVGLTVALTLAVGASQSLVPTPTQAAPSTSAKQSGHRSTQGALQLVVKVDPSTGIRDVAARYGLVVDDTLLASRGIYLVHSGDPKVQGNESKVRDLAKHVGEDFAVAYAEINETIALRGSRYSGWPEGRPTDANLHDADYRHQGVVAGLELEQAQSITRGQGTTIAILDTGVDAAHPGLDGVVSGGWDYVDDDGTPADSISGTDSDSNGVADDAAGHGTYVAGLAHLVAPGARIVPYRVLDSDGIGSTYAAAQAVLDAAAANVDVLNLSFGTSVRAESKLLEEALRSAQKAGIVVVAAAGNNGNQVKQYPAAFANVLAISAIDGNRLAKFSNRGGWVDIGAPGVGLVGPLPGGGFGRWSGTSAAAPLVSGEVALMKSTGVKTDAARIRDLVVKTGYDLPKNKTDEPDERAREVDVVGALNALLK